MGEDLNSAKYSARPRLAVYDNERNLRSGTMQTVRYAERCGLTGILLSEGNEPVGESGDSIICLNDLYSACRFISEHG